MNGSYVIEAMAVPESLNLLHELFEQVRRDHPGLGDGDAMMFETAIVEITGNVIEHGRPPGGVRYRFDLEVLVDRLDGLLTDTGEEPGMPTGGASMPDELAESGRGLLMARAAVDEFSYARIADTNTWRLIRRRR